MSTWTNEKHANAKAWVADPVLGSSTMRQLDKGKSLLGDALGEIERLQARPTITHDMIERAAQAIWQSVSLFRGGTPLPDPDSTDANDAGAGRRYRRAATAALTAALADIEGDQE